MKIDTATGITVFINDKKEEIMGTAHTNLTNRIKTLFDKEGVWYVHYYSGGFGSSGIPDLLCCYKGFFVAVEIKTSKNDRRQLQDYTIKQIQLHLGYAFRFVGWDDFLKQWDEIKIKIDNDFDAMNGIK